MRQLRTSNTFDDQLADLLVAGAQHYGPRLLAEKRLQVYHVLESVIVHFPELKQRHPHLKLVAYPISKTPFIVLYDFDDHEVRAHFIVHKNADLDAIDPGAADWS